MSVQRSSLIALVLVAVIVGGAAGASLLGSLAAAKAFSIGGLLLDIVGALVLGVGLLNPPEIRSTYRGKMPAVEHWFAGGRRDGQVGLTLIVAGFAGQLLGTILS